MNANDPDVALLEIVAERLGDDLRDEMVFVGGAGWTSARRRRQPGTPARSARKIASTRRSDGHMTVNA